MQIKVRAVMLNEEGKILLQKSAQANFWCLPGGTFEEGEVLEECLKREIIEELGIEPVLGDTAHVQSFVRTKSHDPSRNGTSVVDVWYFVENPSDFRVVDLSKASHGFESETVEWFSADELPQGHAPSYLAEIVTNWNTNGKRFVGGVR